MIWKRKRLQVGRHINIGHFNPTADENRNVEVILDNYTDHDSLLYHCVDKVSEMFRNYSLFFHYKTGIFRKRGYFIELKSDGIYHINFFGSGKRDIPDGD